MLTYECPTCHNKYDCSVSGSAVYYMIENRRLELKDEKDDCEDCKEKIAHAEEAERERIRSSAPVEETI